MSSIKRRPDGKWRARYRDDSDNKEHAQHFERKIDAQRWLDQVTASQVRGDYIDPRAGKVTFKAFAEQWLAAQTFDESTREAVASRLNTHVYPTFSTRELRAIRPSTVQAWLRERQEHCAPRSVRVILANVSSVFGAAVEDGLIARNPCRSRAVSAPKVEQIRVMPWSYEQVAAVIAAHPGLTGRYRWSRPGAGSVKVRCSGCASRTSISSAARCSSASR